MLRSSWKVEAEVESRKSARERRVHLLHCAD